MGIQMHEQSREPYFSRLPSQSLVFWCEALFTWLLYSFGQLPIVVVPTVLSAILALVPKVSPVWSISVWAAGYLWLHNQRICAALCHGNVSVAVWCMFLALGMSHFPRTSQLCTVRI